MIFPHYNFRINKDLIKHFIRGFFDGDGCLHVYKNRKKATFSIIGIKLFLDKINEYLQNELKIDSLSFYPKGKMYYITTTKHEKLEKIYHLLYDNANVYLERKKEKFLLYFRKKMSSLIIKICKIEKILAHNNADSLQIVKMSGNDWQCVVKKDQFKIGDEVIYIPIDTLLPQEIIEKNGLTNYLVGKNKNRVKCVKLRGEMSYGIILPNSTNYSVGSEISEFLGAKKYEPPVRGTIGDARPDDPFFPKMSDIEHLDNYPDEFEIGELVAITEKIDGCFEGSQKVMLANGDQIPISEIKVGTKILSFDEQKQDFVESEVLDVIKNNKDKKWIKLTFDNKTDIICTTNHLFLTKNRGWVEAQELEEKDDLVSFY